MIRRSQEGMLTLWVGALAVVLMFFGGVALDVWNVFRVDQEVGDITERTAKAGGNGIDEDAYRATSTLVIDEARAESFAWSHLRSERGAALLASAEVEASSARNEVTVTLTRRVPFLLLDVFMPGEDPLTVRRTATAHPERSA